ncbi:hypothetical protein ACJJTC_009523 [Scirpophaga incertulas]
MVESFSSSAKQAPCKFEPICCVAIPRCAERPINPGWNSAIAQTPRYVRNSVLLRDYQCDKIEDYIRRVASLMFERASRSQHTLIREIAPHHARPPEGRRRGLPRDLITIKEDQE